jgi:predicted transcriptional regulator
MVSGDCRKIREPVRAESDVRIPSVAHMISYLRHGSGYRVAQIAAELGVERHSIERWARGSTPQVGHWRRLAKFYLHERLSLRDGQERK